MFSAFKRFTTKNEGPANNNGLPKNPNVQAMSSSLQRKFAKGVQYNSEYFLLTLMS